MKRRGKKSHHLHPPPSPTTFAHHLPSSLHLLVSSLLDELLMKIDGLSDSLELSILENQWKRALESRAGDSPPVGSSEYQATGVRLYKLFLLMFYTTIFIF